MIVVDSSIAQIINTGITSLFQFLGLMCTGLLAYYTLKLNQKVDIAAKVGIDTHALVNSAMGAQLKLAATLSMRIAKLTNDPGDMNAALDAQRLYNDHVAKQKALDATNAAKDATKT